MKRFLTLLISALSLGGLSAAIFYVLFKKDEEEFDSAVVVSEQTVIKVKIPKELVGVFIGRGGTNIRRIQEESKARLHMGPDYCSDENFRECTVYGTPAIAQRAETLIREFIMKQPKTETFEMSIPQRYIGRIIGRKGENIRQMSRNSCAKITVEDDEIADQGKITIKGTAEQVSHARKLIAAALEEYEIRQQEQARTFENRSPRSKPKNDSNNASLVETSAGNSQNDKVCLPRGFENWNVFVSALDTPCRFWVQVINERARELDKLVNDMTAYYSTEESHELHKLSDITVGNIVAAPFPDDEKYYRARVLSTSLDEQQENKKHVTVQFVDYGDHSTVEASEVLELRTDFLTLRYQAIECFLADIAPLEAKWPEEAIDLFDDLAEVAKWKTKIAVFMDYPDWNKTSSDQVEKAYAVELFAMNGNKLQNIGDALVEQGFAVKSNGSESTENWNEPAVANPPGRVLPELSDSGSDIEGFYMD